MKKNIYMICIATAWMILISYTPGHTQATDIQNLTWLVGHWAGDGMGGFNEEVWTTPVDNKMVGVYRHIKDDKIVFYELLTIMRNENDQIVLRLKHFNPDLTGWEDKDKYVEFKLLRLEPEKVEFEGLSIHLIKKDTLLMTVNFQQKSGEISTEEFKLYKRYE